jgi:hypothetical protein
LLSDFGLELLPWRRCPLRSKTNQFEVTVIVRR